MKTWLHVAGMFVFGAAALLCVAFLYRARTADPFPVILSSVPAPVGTSGRADGAERRIEPAIAGVRADLEFFAANVASRRSDAVRALDGAYRVAQVLNGASRGAAAPLVERVAKIRMMVQDGRAEQAAANARLTAAPLVASDVAAPLHAPAAADYVGATVLLPTGAVAGRIVAARPDAVQVEAGGVMPLLGFIDLREGACRELPVENLIFGERRRGGMTMVISIAEQQR